MKLIIITIIVLSGMALGQTSDPNAYYSTAPLQKLSSQIAPTEPFLEPPTLRLVSPNGNAEFELKITHGNDGNIKDVTLSLDAKEGGRIDRISDSEFERLQKLRQAVKDAEVEIARAHGVKTEESCIGDTANSKDVVCRWTKDPIYWRASDHYEFHGQFLLVNLPKAAPPESDAGEGK
jgi:hypothetical protein